MQTSTGPVTLSSLPNEILEQIFSDGTLSKPDLCSLALVNWRFSRLIPASLYKSVNCDLDDKTYRPLLRTLNTHPELGALVRSLFLDCQQHTGGGLIKATLISRAFDLLSKLPALQNLQLGPRVPFTDGVSSLLETPMQALRVADLRGHLLTAVELGKLMLLPKIEIISGKFQPDFNDKESDRLTLRSLAGKSSLKGLRLWGIGGNEPPELLAIPKALESFAGGDDWNDEEYPVSPKRFASLLMPACMTLVQLSLSVAWDEDGESRGDGSCIDFSCFVSLRVLKVDRLYCFPNDGEDKDGSRRGFYKRLPVTLKSLAIEFQSFTGACIPRDYGREQDQEDQYTWVLELAQNKALHFPSLAEVHLSEEYHTVCAFSVEWRKPKDLSDACTAAGIDLTVILTISNGRHRC